MLQNLAMQFIGFVVRITMILWPLWLILFIRAQAGVMVPEYPWHTPAMTAAPLLILPIILFLDIIGVRSPLSLTMGLFLVMASGAYTIVVEVFRLKPYADYYPIFELMKYADKYAVAGAAVTVAIPLVAMLKLSGYQIPFLKTHTPYKRSKKSTYGSADWYQLKDAKKDMDRGLLVVGEAYTHTPKIGVPGESEKLRVEAKGHLLSIAGSGSGKSTSIVVPNMLEWPHSAICIDPKTEIAAITKRRRRALGQRVVLLNADDSNSDGFNVLDWIDTKHDKAVLDAQAVISWLSEKSGGEKSTGAKFFDQAARNLLEAILMDVLFNESLTEADRNLLTVRKLLVQPDMIEYLRLLQGRGDDYAYGAAAGKAGPLIPMMAKGEQTAAGIIGTADNMTQFLNVPSLSRLVCGNSFKTDSLISGGVTVYVQIPLKTLDATPAIARLIIGALLNRIYEAKGEIKEQVLVMLDEMPRLGHMKLLETARDAGRSYGLRLWGICQSTGQLEKIYGHEGMRDWQESCFVRSFFGIQDEKTAEMVSRTCGTTTVSTKAESAGRSGSRRAQDVAMQSSQNESVNIGETGRRLITADEVMRMGEDADGNPDEQIVFIRNKKPLRCGLLKYYRRFDYVQIADKNPFM